MVALHSLVLALALTVNSDPVLLNFSADWCGPCRQMEPVIGQLSAAGYPIRKVNIDQERALASQHQVTGIPCFVLMANGREVDRLVGAVDAAQLVAMFERAGVKNRGSGAGGQGPAIQGRAAVIPAVASQTPFSPAASPAAAAAGQLQPSSGASVVRDRVLAASVRLKIQDPDGNSVGSGTIIDAREGEALVLTCGHVFRDSQGKGQITVDLFGPRPAEGIPARLINYDLKSDVGLVSFRSTAPITPARVAPAGHRFATGDAVINVGCSHGAEPTVRESRIAALDRFLGPPNVQVSGQPVQGRSGGGLFSSDGLVIGVCNAADPSANEGLYAALGSIHAALDRANLSTIYDSPPQPKGDDIVLAAITPPAMPAKMPATPIPQPSTINPQPSLDPQLSTLNSSPDAEVICIVRSHSNSRAKSEIIVLDRATPGFLDWLATEQRSQSARQMTSLQVPGAEGIGNRETGSGRGALTANATPVRLAPTALRWLRPMTPVSEKAAHVSDP